MPATELGHIISPLFRFSGLFLDLFVYKKTPKTSGWRPIIGDSIWRFQMVSLKFKKMQPNLYLLVCKYQKLQPISLTVTLSNEKGIKNFTLCNYTLIVLALTTVLNVTHCSEMYLRFCYDRILWWPEQRRCSRRRESSCQGIFAWSVRSAQCGGHPSPTPHVTPRPGQEWSGVRRDGAATKGKPPGCR